MLAISVARFGGPEVLIPAQAPDPVAGPGEVVIAVTASDVMFVDTMIRSGRGAGFFPIRPPYVPGNGVAGRVTSVGDGVDAGWLGRPAIAHTGGPGGSGGYAEQAVAGLEDTVLVPDGLDPLSAAAIATPGGATSPSPGSGTCRSGRANGPTSPVSSSPTSFPGRSAR